MKVGQVAVALLEVEAVPDEELVRDREADVADGQILDQAAVRAVEKRCGRERARLPEAERPEQVVERQAGVDDVVDEEHVAADVVRVEILQEPDAVLASGVAPAVRGELEEVDPVRDRERPAQVGDEDEARLQQPDEDGLAARVVLADLAAEFADASSDLLRAEVDLSCVVVSYDASFSRYRWARRSRSRR